MKKTTQHVFISYSRQNIDARDQIISRLKEADIPIWYDHKDIESGDKWKPQIDDALEDSFAVVVVVTPASMKSLYVTYEWSWALGSSIPVFPLLMGGDFRDIHSRLLDEHVVDCRNRIPDHVIQTLEDKKTTPPDTSYLNDLIRQLVSPLWVLVRTSTWIDSATRTNDSRDVTELQRLLIYRIGKLAQHLSEAKLPGFLVENSHAFTRKHKNQLRQLICTTSNLSATVNFYITFSNQFEGDKNLPQEEFFDWLRNFFEEDWLPVTKRIDDKYNLAGFLDQYLGIQPDKNEDERSKKFLDEMYETNKDKYSSRQEFDKELEASQNSLEKDSFVGGTVKYILLRKTFDDDQLSDTVFDVLEELKQETLNNSIEK